MVAQAIIATPNAERYITRLCRHFAHKVPAESSGGHGTVRFAMGGCEMQATPEQLTLQVHADDQAALDRVKAIVVSHLEQFAHREEVTVIWAEMEAPVAE